jgi:crotonobetainyl-CoA:carnitine CoA-transferase CaiB-like acyl-CoA transferase
MALLDVMVAVLANQGLNYLVSGATTTRLGNRHPNIAPYEAFPTDDGWMILAVGNDSQFARFCALAGLPALERDPRFACNADRVAHQGALSALISAATRRWQRDALLARCEAEGVPAGPINTLAQAFADPQIKHRRIAYRVRRTVDGNEIPAMRTPIIFSSATLALDRAAPMLGQDED